MRHGLQISPQVGFFSDTSEQPWIWFWTWEHFAWFESEQILDRIHGMFDSEWTCHYERRRREIMLPQTIALKDMLHLLHHQLNQSSVELQHVFRVPQYDIIILTPTLVLLGLCYPSNLLLKYLVSTLASTQILAYEYLPCSIK